MNRHCRFAACIASLVLMSGAAQAEKAQFSDFVPPSYPMALGHIAWADAVRKTSNGELDWEVFTAGALLPATGTMQGIASGVVQGGQIAPPYQPSELPIANLVGDMGWLNPDDLVLAVAYADFAVNDKAQYDEYRNNGVIFGAATVSTPVYHYICRGDVRTMDDMKGKRVRVPGGAWARFSEHVGFVPVSIPASEIYSAMERGAVDCVAGDLSQLIGFNLLELANSVVTVPLSPAFASAWIAYNPDYWQGLQDDQRRLLLDETARAMAHTYVLFGNLVSTGRDAAVNKGIAIHEADEALMETYRNWVAGGFGGLDEIARDRLRIQDPKPAMASFQGYLEKWTKLFEGVDRTDEEALTAVIKANLHDKIAVSTYGME